MEYQTDVSYDTVSLDHAHLLAVAGVAVREARGRVEQALRGVQDACFKGNFDEAEYYGGVLVQEAKFLYNALSLYDALAECKGRNVNVVNVQKVEFQKAGA